MSVVPEPGHPRLRFAPSPTGYLHVGGARAVLYNWLFARQQGGRLLLRIEDTDVERNRPELVDNILDMILWLGLEWDGEPVHQSDRLDLYRDAAAKLVAAGRAYWCDCQPAAVQARAAARGGPPGYDGFCRDRGLGPGPGAALRFRAPDDGTTVVTDVVRGEVAFENRAIEDFVILRSSGIPTFLLANLVDDADMTITHVLRGEEHLNGTPKYVLLGEALGLAHRPVFAHLPILVNERRQKLSKRRDDISVADYKAQGFLPEAMVNYLALLGWGPPDGVEVRPLVEMVELFRLEDVNPSPAFFDVRKLTHINGEYIRALPLGEFLARADDFITHGEPARRALRSMGAEVQPRITTLAEAEGYADFLFLDEPVIDEAAWLKATKDERAPAMLDLTRSGLDGAEWTVDGVEAAVRDAALAAGYVNAEGNPQLAKAQAPIRVAITGRAVGPPLWQSIVVLGREATASRLAAARAKLP
ncbi:MAG: glutamate--tRNA ligase [Acidimicrobiales bacterium]